MLSNIITENGLDLGIAASGSDLITVSQLPPEQVAYFSASPFPDAIALLEGDDYAVNDNTGRIFYGNQGIDTIIGGGGSDTLFGGQDNDFLEATGGNNILFGNFGNDTLSGGPGNDSLYGGAGNDVIVGGTGNSIISGDKGLDTLTGGGGANQFILQSSGTDRDVITDFKPGIDKMRLPTGVTFADLQVRGSGGNTEILRNGEVLAILNGVISSSINSNDFITAGQETSPTLPVSVEPGNTPETAGDLGLFSGIREFNNFVGTADNNDYYRFTLSEVHDVKLTLFGMSDDANLTLYVGDEKPDDSIKMGQQITTSNNSGTRDESITLPLGEGTYFVKVYPEYTSTNTRYDLTLEATPTGIVDHPTTQLIVIDSLEVKQTFRNFVGTADPVDYYFFTLNEVRDLDLKLFDMSDDANVTLYLAEQDLDGWDLGQQIATSNNSGTRDESITRSLGAGDYFVKVYPEYTSTNTRYALTLEATA